MLIPLLFLCSCRQWLWWAFTTLLTGRPGSFGRRLSQSYRPSS